MLNWLKGKKKDDAPKESEASAASPAPAAGPVDRDAVKANIIQWVCDNSSRPLTPEAIDTTVHIYDAGYVDSMRGVDLLVHVETSFGLSLSEADLVSRLAQIDNLVDAIVAGRG